MVNLSNSRTWLVWVVLPAVVFLSFGGTLWSGFVYDDVKLIVEGDALKALMAGAPGPDVFFSDFARLGTREEGVDGGQRLGYFRPVIVMSYVVDAWFWSDIGPPPPGESSRPGSLRWDSLNPVGFHLTNLLIHLVNCLLVFRIVLTLIRGRLAALVIGVLFAAHPIHAENVCWIAGRTDVLAGTFFFLAFWLYLRHRKSGARPTHVLSLVAFALGLLTKESVLVLPLTLLALEGILPHPRGLSRSKAILATWPYLAGFFIYFLLRLLLWPAGTGDNFLDPGTLEPLSVFTLAVTFLEAGAWYLGKCIWPFPLNPYADVSFLDAVAVGTWLPFCLLHLALVLPALYLILRKRAVWIAYSITAFYLSLAPLSCLLPGTRLARFAEDQAFPVAERFLYLPSFFVLLALTHLGKHLGRRPALATVGILAGVCTLVNGVRCSHYRDNLSFFQAAVEAAPQSVRMHTGLGFQLLDRYDMEQALRHFVRARHLVHDVHQRTCYPPVQAGLAAAYRMQGDSSKVFKALEAALRQEPGNMSNALNLAVYAWNEAILHMDVARIQFALEMARRAVGQAPEHPLARKILDQIRRTRAAWNLYFVQKHRDDATLTRLGKTFFVPAMSALEDPGGPRFSDALKLLRSGLRHTGVPEEKRGDMPRTLELRERLKTRFEEVLDRARLTYGRLLERHPESAALYYLLGEVHGAAWRRTGEAHHRDAALEAYLECARREPGHVQAVLGAGRILVGLDRHDEAMALVRAGVEDGLTQKYLGTWPVPLQPRKTLDIVGNVAARPGLPAKWRVLAGEQIQKILRCVEERARTTDSGRNADQWNEAGWFRVYAGRMLGRPDLTEAALQAFQKALDIDARHPGAKQNLKDLQKQLSTANKEKE